MMHNARRPACVQPEKGSGLSCRQNGDRQGDESSPDPCDCQRAVALTRHSIATNRAESKRTSQRPQSHERGGDAFTRGARNISAQRLHGGDRNKSRSHECLRKASEPRPTGRVSRDRFSVNHAASHAGFELDDVPRQDAHPGAVIASPSLDEVNELYEIRITLEPLASARHIAGLIEKTRGPALGDG
jgi:hypothetical protein